MAVASIVEKIPKGEPDTTKLTGFTGYMVTVSRYLQPRGGVGTTMVPTQHMKSLQDVLGLVTTVPLQGGPGFYKFTVADAGGTGEDVWMTKLGNGDVPQQEGNQMNVIHGAPTAPDGTPSAGVRNIGRGFAYDPELRILTTPWGTGVNWSPGEPFPEPPTNPRGAATPAATPWNWQGQQGGWPGWSGLGIPMNDSSESKEVAALKAQIAEQARQREMDNLRADVKRGQDETAKMIASLVETLKTTLAPKGPSDTERQLEETRRRVEESERRAEQQRREDQQRLEQERRDAQHRQELRDLADKTERALAAATANKTDPMLPLLMQLLTNTQNSASESVKAIQASTTAAAAASERSMQQLAVVLGQNNMTPMQMIQLMQTVKGDASENTKMLMESARDALNIQKEAVTYLRESVGQSDQPWYAGAIQQGLEKIGAVGAALAERSAAQAQQQAMQPVMQPQVRRAPQMVQQQPAPGQMNGVSTAQIAPPTNQRPEGAVLDEPAGVWRLRDGRTISHADVQTNGWAVALGRPPGTVPATAATSAPEVVTGELITPPPAAPAFVEQAPNVTPINSKKGKKGGKKGKNDAPPADPQGYTLAEMRDMSPDDIRQVTDLWDDAKLFGPLLLPYVLQLRATTPLPEPAEVAQKVLQAQGQIQGFGGEVPPAMELLVASQLEVLVERLLPEATDEYQDAVIEAIANEAEADLDEGEQADEPA